MFDPVIFVEAFLVRFQNVVNICANKTLQDVNQLKQKSQVYFYSGFPIITHFSHPKHLMCFTNP